MWRHFMCVCIAVVIAGVRRCSAQEKHVRIQYYVHVCI